MEIAMEKARRLLADRSGRAMLTPVVAVLLSTMFIILLSHFIYLYSMTTGIADYIQEAIIQTATANAYNVYDGIREGNSSAHQYAGSGVWNELVSTAEMSDRLEEMLQLTETGNSLYKYDDGGRLKYGISDISVHCTNVNVGASVNDVRLTFHTTATAEIPLRFLGAELRIRKSISLKSYYTPLF